MARQVPQPSRATWLVVRQVRKAPPTRDILAACYVDPRRTFVLHLRTPSAAAQLSARGRLVKCAVAVLAAVAEASSNSFSKG